jgi:hypothetical protein
MSPLFPAIIPPARNNLLPERAEYIFRLFWIYKYWRFDSKGFMLQALSPILAVEPGACKF